MAHEYASSATHEKAERSGFIANSFAFAKSVAKRRLPGGATKTTSNRDSKARRREEGNQRKGGSDRRDANKGKDDLLDVPLFELLKKSMWRFRSISLRSPDLILFTEIGDPLNDDVIKRAA